jgi:hypothetical protein
MRFKPLTARAIARGPQLADKVDHETQGAHNGTRSTTYFLFGYYDFISHVANFLDMPYYIPYHHCRAHRCGGGYEFDVDAFESRFVDYTKEQVQLVLTRLSESNGWQVFPVGAYQGYLGALQLVTSYAANDLGESPWSARYACARMTLSRLSERIASFRPGFGGAYGGDPIIAVQSSHDEAQYALNSISAGYGCR